MLNSNVKVQRFIIILVANLKAIDIINYIFLYIVNTQDTLG